MALQPLADVTARVSTRPPRPRLCNQSQPGRIVLGMNTPVPTSPPSVSAAPSALDFDAHVAARSPGYLRTATWLVGNKQIR